MRFSYPLELERDEDGRIVVAFPDVPGALTDGADEAEALALTEDCLVAALGGYVRQGKPIPGASSLPGTARVDLPPLLAAKLAVYEAMRSKGIGEGVLADTLGVSVQAVRRLIDLDCRSHIGEVEKALAALGKRLVVEVLEAA
jgi:antitoxin HicB